MIDLEVTRDGYKTAIEFDAAHWKVVIDPIRYSGTNRHSIRITGEKDGRSIEVNASIPDVTRRTVFNAINALLESAKAVNYEMYYRVQTPGP